MEEDRVMKHLKIAYDERGGEIQRLWKELVVRDAKIIKLTKGLAYFQGELMKMKMK